MKSKSMALACALAALILSSCAHKGQVKQEAAAVPSPVPSPQAEAPKPALQHYVVAKGDCLWTIAAKPSVLGDAFHWPLLYKQNRDQIEDPDIIEPKQDLAYRSHYSEAEYDLAQRQAAEMPAYVPHSVPAAIQKLKD